MSRIYITSNNGTLSSTNGVLYYDDYKGNRSKLLLDRIDQLMILGKITITSGALSELLKAKVDIIFLQKDGRYAGKLIFNDNKNTLLRHKQHSLYDDKERATVLTKDIVRGKLHNQYLFLQRIDRKHPDDKEITYAIHEFTRIRRLVENANSVETIRGYEGSASMLYFSCFGKNIHSEWTSFSNRTKNPPLDPINSVLSFLYTVLANHIESYIHQEGLDPSIGTLHSISYGRASLVYDLIEEFRTPIVDTLTCSLFNLRVLSPNDFRTESIEVSQMDDELLEQESNLIENAVLLTEEGMKKALMHFEKKLETVHSYPVLGKALPYKRILQEQVKIYKKVIGGSMDHYLPLIVT